MDLSQLADAEIVRLGRDTAKRLQQRQSGAEWLDRRVRTGRCTWPGTPGRVFRFVETLLDQPDADSANKATLEPDTLSQRRLR